MSSPPTPGSELHVGPVRVEATSGGYRIETELRWSDQDFVLYFDVAVPDSLGPPERPVEESLAARDLAAAVALLPAMSMGTPLSIPGSTDETAPPENAVALGRRFSDWYPFLNPVPIEVRPTAGPAPVVGGGGGAVFFSGGVDSWYTLLENWDDVGFLLCVHGFDIRIDDEARWTQTEAALREAAQRIDKPLVTVRTNLREFSDRSVGWPVYHGAAIGAVAAALTPFAARFHVASSVHESRLFPYGSHPETDPLWAGPGWEIVHHGIQATRLDKTRRVAEEEAARQSLRVCWQNLHRSIGSAYNCSECRKCTITMLSLELLDQLEATPTFQPRDLRALAREADFTNSAAAVYFDEIIAGYRERKPESPFLRDLLYARRMRYVRGAADRIRQRAKALRARLGF